MRRWSGSLLDGRAGEGGSRFLRVNDAWASTQRSAELRVDQKQDPAAAFFVNAVHRKAVPKQVTEELNLAN